MLQTGLDFAAPQSMNNIACVGQNINTIEGKKVSVRATQKFLKKNMRTIFGLISFIIRQSFPPQYHNAATLD